MIKLSTELNKNSWLPTFIMLSGLFCSISVCAQVGDNLPFPAENLTLQGDLSALMVQGIDQFLMKETVRAEENRSAYWNRDFSSANAYNKSISSQRDFLSKSLGIVDTRISPKMQIVTGKNLKPLSIETDKCTISAVKWNVLEGLEAEGLLLRPKGKVKAVVVMIPDADELPETLAGLQNPTGKGYAVAQRLANEGCDVLIPVLVSREDKFSGNPSLNLYTNQTHREWIYRQGYEVGRHVIGYELQKIFSAIDWLDLTNKASGTTVPIGVAGYGEGGMLALYAAALDTRISTTLVTGYFNSREKLWQEPIYRNVFGLLKQFGDAELAAMSWPRQLLIEQSKAPEVVGPPTNIKGRSVGSPGDLTTPDIVSAKAEWDKAKTILSQKNTNLWWFANGNATFKEPFSVKAMNRFREGLKLKSAQQLSKLSAQPIVSDWVNLVDRQERTVKGMEKKIQSVLLLCERTRNKNIWQRLSGDTTKQGPVKDELREQFWAQIGKLPTPEMPINPNARILEKTDKWTSYEVMLDVWPGVFTWGIILIPNDLKHGEKRPVVVCQHGLEGEPKDVVGTDPKGRFYKFYKGFAANLADKGYITFAPANLYRGEDKFRVLQRKSNPLGLSLFSVIIGQHQRIVEWLQQLNFVDPQRIGFYGLSYGGKTAMRVPAVVKGYALSICSGDFNEWVRKATTTDYPFSYLFSEEYDMQEWDLGHTFNYAEMAALIAPRPFMVERGHFDTVATDEWVGYEFEKVRRHYDLLQIPERTQIEYFAGPHTINGVGTFKFLDRFLNQNSK